MLNTFALIAVISVLFIFLGAGLNLLGYLLTNKIITTIGIGILILSFGTMVICIIVFSILMIPILIQDIIGG